MSLSKTVKELVSKVDSRKLRSNTQRVLVALLKADGQWVSRGSVRVRNATSRMRELRQEKFGGFDLQVAHASELGRSGTNTTYYRLAPSTVTVDKVKKVLKDVI